jgi:response regulator RpfG family c-di-GMP phosphodiesterase
MEKGAHLSTLDEVSSPTARFNEVNPAQLLLRELRRTSLILAEDWANLKPEQRDRLLSIGDIPALLDAQVEDGLLTAYQSHRISRGELYGLVLGNYRVLAKLGAGGMGVVYRAEHRLMRRQVAVKVVSVLGETDRESEARFFAELRAVSQLQHPNIVGALDAGEVISNDSFVPTLYYYVMELIPGQSLEELVKSLGPLPVERACDYVCQIADALEQAHQHDLVHRDLKPSNVMVTPEGQSKLLDFGLVRDLRHRVTRPGVPLGTLAYMAPEQARDASAVDRRVDVYGLGSTLFWALTGRAPFESQHSLGRDLLSRLTQAPPDVRAARPALPEALALVVARMMAFDPAERYPTVQAARQALLPFLKPPPAPARADVFPLIATEPLGHRILVVDDEADLRRYCKLVLGSDTLQCEEAADGEAALAATRDRPYDLILMDCQMPKRGGIDVARALRQRPPCPNLKIILMSGQTAPDELARLMMMGVDDFLTKPFSKTQLQARVKAALRLKDAQDRGAQLVTYLLRFNKELERTVNARDVDLIQARNAIVLALAKLAEYRDNETGAHLLRLERYCRCVGEEAARHSVYAAEINDSFLDMLVCCAPLHDIGKVGVPDHILHKPGPLDADEKVVMQSHTVIGAETLRAVAQQHGFALPMLHMAAEVARHHHERYDGSGYPDGLTGTDIPLSARIVAIADVYDALRSRRIYKPALPHEQTVEVMLAGFGTQFDPALLETFRRCAPQFEHIFTEWNEESGD